MHVAEAARRGRISRRRTVVYGVVSLGAALLILALFVWPSEPGQETTFVLNPARRSRALPVPDLVFPTVPALYVFALGCAAIGGWQLVRGFRRPNWALGGVAALFVLAFLTWAARGRSLNLTAMLSSSLLRAVPIAFAGLSGVLCERSGVINIAIEGMMLVGAFVAALMGSLAANRWGWASWASMPFGLTSALAAGLLLGLLLGILAIRFRVEQIIAGTAINILAVGITSFLSARILSEFQELNAPGVMPPLSIPGLSAIPVLGPVFLGQNLFVYLLFFVLTAAHVMLFYAPWGLRTRAVGEHPRAADTLGIDVYKVRYVDVMLGGMVGSLGGAFLILGSVGRFDALMTAGKGFIGLAAMIFGNWTPFGTLGAALIFGFADALQTRLAILRAPIPSQFLLMAPYLATIIVLAGVVGEVHPPAADGQPYEKQQ